MSLQTSSTNTWAQDTKESSTIQAFKPQRLPNLVVKIKATEASTVPPQLESAVHLKRHRFSKWLKSSFQWCVKALSLCCLRQHQRSESDVSCQGPVLDSKPTISSNERGESLSVDFVPIQSPTVGPVVHNDSANTTTISPEHAPPDTTSEAGLVGEQAMELELETLLARPKGSLDLFPVLPLSVPAKPLERLSPPDALYNDSDDLNMRSARLAAREIEWFEGKPSQPPPATQSRAFAQKSGTWISDEHARYCEALAMYRYRSWRQIAAHVGTRTERQVLSHAQSVRAKEKRAEERKKRHLAGTTASNAEEQTTRSSLSAAPPTKMRKRTPEEFLRSYMPDRGTFRKLESTRHLAAREDHYSKGLELKLKPRGFGAEQVDPVISGDKCELDDIQRSEQHLKSNPDMSTATNSPVDSPPLEFLLDVVLSDEDLLELLEIPSTPQDAPSIL